MFSRSRFMTILLIGFTFVGCKHEMTDQERLEKIHGKMKKVVPVGGIILVNGKAESGVAITLYNAEGLDAMAPKDASERIRPKPIRSAQAEDDGSFAFTTYINADGVEPGKYKVTFQWFAMVKDKKLGLKGTGSDKMNGAYSDPITSEHVLVVEEDQPQTELVFNLKTNG